jgi:DNA-binding transcriptional regulator YiaG
MMIRASEPPMKLRLLMESANLKICLFIELSYPRVFAMVNVVPYQQFLLIKQLSTKPIDHSMTPAQCRAARALLGITQSQLARAAKLGLSTVVDFEKERRLVSEEAVKAIQTALQRAGIEFMDEDGVGEGLLLRKRQKRT